MQKTSSIGLVLAASLMGGACYVGAGGQTRIPRRMTSLYTNSAAAQSRQPAARPYVWRNVEIVAGGFVSGIIFNPTQPDLLYARTDIGGAYRWNPAAKRWIPLTDWVGQNESNLLGIESLATDPVDPRRVYLAAGTYIQSWAGNGAILRSGDQGRTWQRTNMPFKMGGNENGRSTGERLAVDPCRNSVLYFGSRLNGLWRSGDYGATWSKVDSFPATGKAAGIGIGFVVFDPHSGAQGKGAQTLYAGVADPDAGLYHSQDGGATWAVAPGQPKGFLPHHAALDRNGVLYLTYGNQPGPNGMTDGAVWKWDTRSGVWTDITPVKPGSGGMGTFGYAGLALDATRPGTVMVTSMDKWSTGDDTYRTRDGGAHWTALKAASVRDSSLSPYLNWNRGAADMGHWMGALAIDPFHPGHVLYGTGATIWGSEDVTASDTGKPTHWRVEAEGLEETAVIDLVSPPAGAHLLSGLGDIGGFRHDDLNVSPRGGIRVNPIMNNTDSLDFAEQRPDFVVRVGRGERNKSGAYSEDGGATWTPFASEPAGGRGGGAAAVSADGKTIVWTPANGAASFSTDRGATWTACKGLPGRLNVLADRVTANTFYALDANAGKLYVSADGGINFSVRAENLSAGHGKLRAAFGKVGDLWLASASGAYHSTDGGASFSKANDVQEAWTLGFGKAAPEQNYPAIYMTGKIKDVIGVYRSDNGGAAWTRINDDQHQYGWIGQVVIGDPRVYGRVYIGTNGRGILYGEPASLSQSAQR